jgi:hypothetical protein
MSATLKLFRNLHHLAALETISLRFCYQQFGVNDDMTEERWSDLDKVLMQARGPLKEVEIYAQHRRTMACTARCSSAAQTAPIRSAEDICLSNINLGGGRRGVKRMCCIQEGVGYITGYRSSPELIFSKI